MTRSALRRVTGALALAVAAGFLAAGCVVHERSGYDGSYGDDRESDGRWDRHDERGVDRHDDRRDEYRGDDRRDDDRHDDDRPGDHR